MKLNHFTAIRLFAVLAIAALLGSCRHDTPSQPPENCCNGIINVTALNAEGHGMQGASVSLTGTTSAGDHVTRGPETTTDGGHTTFREICAGRYEIHVSKDGFTTTENVVEMTCSDTQSVTTTLTPAAHVDDCTSGRIALIVHDSATGTMLTGGSASLYHNGTLVSTKEMGTSAVWEGLGTGHYNFVLSHDGYNGVHFDIDTLTCDANRTVEHNMSALHVEHHDSCCGGVTEMTVTDSSTGHALAGATVILYKSGVQVGTATTTDNGGVRFASLCEGSYRMTINKDGYQQGVIEFSEDCNATHGFHKAILANHTDNCCTAVMSLHVEDSLHNDSNIQGAAVTVRIDGNHDNLVTGTTTDGGNFTTDGLCGHTTYIVTVTKDGYNTKTIVMQFTDCHTYSETVLLAHH